MNRKQILQSIQLIYATNENEIDCDHVKTLLPQYVEVEIDSNDALARFPHVHMHLMQCPDCGDEYEALRQVAQLEAQDNLPTADEMISALIPEPLRQPVSEAVAEETAVAVPAY